VDNPVRFWKFQGVQYAIFVRAIKRATTGRFWIFNNCDSGSEQVFKVERSDVILI